MAVREVLELQQRARKAFLHRVDELLEQRVVVIVLQPGLAQPEIEGVVAQRRVVGADIEHHRQAGTWRDATAGAVEVELADRDSHAVGAEVAQPEDARAVGDDDGAHRPGRPAAQQLAHAATVPGRDVEPARRLEDAAELLAGLAHRRRVDQRQQLGQVVEQGALEQQLAALAQGHQPAVAVQVTGLPLEVVDHARDLALGRLDCRRQQPAQAQRVALGLGKRRAAVGRCVAQQGRACQRAAHVRPPWRGAAVRAI